MLIFCVANRGRVPGGNAHETVCDSNQGGDMATETLDAKGLNCPMPIMKAKKAMKGLSAGDTLEIEATDPGAVKDFEAFCRATGNDLLESDEDGGVFRFVLKKN
jgi:tRNA 2-thiouridine synthesizing protein A